MNKAQRNEIKVRIAYSTGYALHQLAHDNLYTVKSAMNDAAQGIRQLIDDAEDRVERREYENEIMIGDEKSEVHEDE